MMASAYNKIRALAKQEQDRLILFVPVCMAMGAAWYLTLPYEPSPFTGLIILPGCLIGRYFTKSTLLQHITILIALAACGVILAQLRTIAVASPILKHAVSYAHVSGTIAEITATPKGSKILLSNVNIDTILPEDTPRYVSISLRTYDPSLTAGQKIGMRAGLYPPPEPALPGGFDFRKHFYFHQIGAVGYAIPPLTISSLKDSGASSYAIWFANFRHNLTESIRSHFREPAGAIAAAFITGETRTIPDSINDNMRVAGLYHLLAVSGMNLSVVAGIAFFSLRLLLAMIPAIALNYPIKKWAALLALVASYLYLQISGSPVSAERAFFMVSLVFIAILLDRDPSPMRAIAFAAFCLIIVEPESVLSAGFQLSFSATAALIMSYEWIAKRFATARYERGIGLQKVALYFLAVLATSTVAWLATEPFIIYHFNQFSSYSLLSNTIAEPLVSFILMPLVIAGVLLMPFHLEWLAFTPMQYGVDALLALADYIAKLPHAMWIVLNPTDNGFIAIVIGGTLIMLLSTSLRWLGLIGIFYGSLSMLYYQPADIFVNNDAKHIAVRLDDGHLAMIKGKSSTLNAQQWLRAPIEQEFSESDANPASCDSYGCVMHLRDKILALPKQPSGIIEDCLLADIIITDLVIDRSHCNAKTIIDHTELNQKGSAALWLGNPMQIEYSYSASGTRPWETHVLEKPVEE